MSWTAFNKPLEVANQDGRMRYTYDADQTRVLKERIATYTTPPPNAAPQSGIWSTTLSLGAFEKRRGSDMPTTDYVFHVSAGDRVIGQMLWRWNGTSGTELWQFAHTDLLGSLERTTDAAGNLSEEASFGPFGDRRSPDWTTSPPSMPLYTRTGYTGHGMDDEFGLIDMGGRIYHPGLKRFLSADPVVPDEDNSFAWNRYGYAYNSPFGFIDPTGHLPAPTAVSDAFAWAALEAGGGTLTTFLHQRLPEGMRVTLNDHGEVIAIEAPVEFSGEAIDYASRQSLELQGGQVRLWTTESLTYATGNPEIPTAESITTSSRVIFDAADSFYSGNGIPDSALLGVNSHLDVPTLVDRARSARRLDASIALAEIVANYGAVYALSLGGVAFIGTAAASFGPMASIGAGAGGGGPGGGGGGNGRGAGPRYPPDQNELLARELASRLQEAVKRAPDPLPIPGRPTPTPLGGERVGHDPLSPIRYQPRPPMPRVGPYR
jgi:RHS repeat-associated protein